MSSWNGCGDITGAYWGIIKFQASKRHLAFDLKISDAWSLYREQEGICVHSGMPIGFGKDRTASLDRINPAKGYSLSNVQWVHKDINRMKWKLTENDFLRWCYLVVNPAGHNQIGRGVTREEKVGPKWTGAGEIPSWLVTRWKEVARRRGKNFSEAVDAGYLWALYVGQMAHCVFTETMLLFPLSSYQRETGNASLDRIDCGIGYEVGNLQWVHKEVNQMRGALSVDDFKRMCRLVVTNSLMLKRLVEAA